jgi:sugar phosphate isomerase/epimerase
LEPIRRTGGPCVKAGCCAYTYRDYLTGQKSPRMTMEDFLNRMADIGVPGVEATSYYFPDPLTYDDIRRVARRAFVLGIDIAGTAIGNNFAIPPGEERDRQIALVRKWIDHAVDMGAPCARVFAGPAPEGVTDDVARGWVVECLETCLEHAQERGVVLALENHGGVVARPEGLLAILAAFDTPWLGVQLDTGNFPGDDPFGDLARCAPFAVAAHLKTDVRRGGVTEPADLAQIVELLRATSYRGYVHLEYEGEEDPICAAPRILGALLDLTR